MKIDATREGRQRRVARYFEAFDAPSFTRSA